MHGDLPVPKVLDALYTTRIIAFRHINNRPAEFAINII